MAVHINYSESGKNMGRIMKQQYGILPGRFLRIVPALFLVGLLAACATTQVADRGAAPVQKDLFGDHYTTIRYLEQGWNTADSLWFYSITQGSNLMPYDFFMVLEKADGSGLFRSDENMNAYRYLPQKATRYNPDALPVGWAKDSYQGKQYIRLTCAACHTAQVNYKGTGIRIDGGPASADMESIMKDLEKAMRHVIKNEEIKDRFVRNVLARGHYSSRSAVLADLERYHRRLVSYVDINRTDVAYGYARLDAFGRIYNRVLEHLVNKRVLEELLHNGRIIGDKSLTEEEISKITRDVQAVMTGEQRDDVVQLLTERLDGYQLGRLRQKLFNMPDAPVSYPFLWDIPQHDYVQWNGLAANAGLGPLGRNTGEVIGVFGTLDWKEEKRPTLSRIIGGQSSGTTKARFDSSINVHNLGRIEAHLAKLQSPKWPEDVLGRIDTQRSTRGMLVFDRYCASCHAHVDRTDPDRRVVAHMSRVGDVGTDPKMAENSFKARGFSGILRNQYVSVGTGSILLDQEAPVAALLTKATLNVVATPDPDKFFFQRWGDWIADMLTTFSRNKIRSSLKHGNYDPDTMANPFASLNAYKARSLNGIWATAPYLHNGSVPTLYDLLLPKKRTGDSQDGEYRPDQFEAGSREFDPEKVGLKSAGYQGFTFKTSLKGNSNAGHEYASGKTPQPDGRILPPLTREERLDLLEYLKTL